MPWPNWTFWRQDAKEDDKKQQDEPTSTVTETLSAAVPRPSNAPSPSSWNSSLNKTDWSHYTTTQTIVISGITTLTTLALIRLYKTYLRRIPSVDYLKPGFFRHRNFYGYVTRVGDGDNFHLFHTPGGKLMGWGWMPGRRAKDILRQAKKKQGTMHVRLAGVDAPEMAHFGRPEQPYGKEALEWLRGFVLGRYVRAYPYRQDQYNRVVCSVYKRRWGLFRSDVGYNMLKSGMATVYEAKFGSEFGNREAEYRAAEERAKQRKIGMWHEPGLVGKLLGKKGSFESPREYKTRMADMEEKNGKTANMAK